MSGPVEYIKEHPLTIVGILGAGLVLYLLFSSGGASGGTVVNSGPVDHTLDVAQLQLQGQTQQLQYKLAETQANNSAQVAIATLQAQLGTLQTAAGRDVSLAGIVAQRDVQLAGISSQTVIAGMAQQTNQMQINATRDLGIATAATYAHIADVNAATVIASYNANVAIQQSNNQTTLAIAQGQQKTQRQGNTLGFIGSLVGGIASIFSDERLKVDVRTLGYDDKGRRWCEYRYFDDAPGTIRTGVMAQEILDSDPQAVTMDRASGYLKVNYGALA